MADGLVEVAWPDGLEAGCSFAGVVCQAYSSETVEQSCLQTICDMTRHFFLDVYGTFAESPIEIHCSLNIPVLSASVWNDLYQRNEMGRIERVTNEHSVRIVLALPHETRRWQP